MHHHPDSRHFPFRRRSRRLFCFGGNVFFAESCRFDEIEPAGMDNEPASIGLYQKNQLSRIGIAHVSARALQGDRICDEEEEEIL